MDIPGSMTDEDCAEEMELTDIRDKPWHIVYVFIFALDITKLSLIVPTLF